MHIEHGLRDFKTHSGVRALRLQVRISERVQRLLMTFTLADALVVALGLNQLAARARLEGRYAVARHGTARILSARPGPARLLGGLCKELLARLVLPVGRLLTRTLEGTSLNHITPTL
jgi:hypothetical protein